MSSGDGLSGEAHVEAGLGPDGRPVAIKRAAGPVATGRLEREAAVLASVRHPGIVEVVDFARDGDQATLTMAWVSAGPLRTAIDHRRDRSGLLAVLADAAATIADLHERSLAHGRIDATHILLSGDGGAVLCGLADAGGGTDPAADVAAIGALAAEIAALPKRNRPLIGTPGVDEARLQHAIGRATDPEGTRRLPARALADLLAGVMPPSPAGQQRVVAPRHGPPVSASRSRRDRARLLAAWAVALVGLVISLGVALPALFGRSRGRSAPTSASDDATTAAVTSATTSATAPTQRTSTTMSVEPSSSNAVRLWPAACVPTSSAVSADVNGDGCTDDVSIIGSTISAAGLRYTVGGDAGDLIAIGDWDCDGVATPAVLREPSGALDVFDTWPTQAQPSITARRVGSYADASAITARAAANGCATIVVTAIDGEHTITS